MKYTEQNIKKKVRIPKNIGSKILHFKVEHIACLYFSFSSVSGSKIFKNILSRTSISILSKYTGYNPKVLRKKIQQLVEIGWGYLEGKTFRLISLESFWNYFTTETYSKWSFHEYEICSAKDIKKLFHLSALKDIHPNESTLNDEIGRGPSNGCNTESTFSISQKDISSVFHKSKSQVHYHMYHLKNLNLIDVKRNRPIFLGKSLSQYNKKMERYTKDLELEDWREKRNENKIFKFNELIVQGVPNTISLLV
jgi:hypothetical protein